jgi:hypothetical protein
MSEGGLGLRWVEALPATFHGNAQPPTPCKLGPERRRVLEKAKDELRALYAR